MSDTTKEDIQEVAGVPLNRKRFQFSLRTVILIIVVYTVSWGITENWGVKDSISYWQSVRKMNSPKSASQLVTTSNEIEIPTPVENFPNQSYVIKATAPMPFLVIEKGEFHRDFGATPEPMEKYAVIWFLGLSFRIHIWEHSGMRVK